MSLRIPPPTSGAAGDGAPGSPASPGLAGGGGAPLTTPFAHDTLSGTKTGMFKRSRLNGTTVLALVVVAAAGVLLGMRYLGRATKIDILDVKIDYPIDGAPQPTPVVVGPVLEDLWSSDKVAQVPLEAVQMNPFEWRGIEAKTNDTVIAVDPEAERLRQKAERERQIAEAAAQLKLNSVVGGSAPVARISGELKRVGDTVGDYFTVKAIEGRSVVLVAEDLSFTLHMGE